MPSLRQKVTTYFRQLSFIAEPREGVRSDLNARKPGDGNFITKYLEGRMESVFTPGPDIYSGQNPKDLPDIPIAYYPTGPKTITAACTGPEEGLTGIKRSKLHLSAGSDIDFIDTSQEQELEIRRSISNQKNKFNSQKYKTDQNANKPSKPGVVRSRKNSRVEVEKDSTDDIPKSDTNNATTIIVSMISSTNNSTKITTTTTTLADNSGSNPKTDFKESQNLTNVASQNLGLVVNSSSNVKDNEKENSSPNEMNCDLSVVEPLLQDDPNNSIEPIAGVYNWKMETDHAYGISVSLYENNMLTNEPMGNPIADCYGVVARGNCAAMALADGVNWGEGARLAARSAVQGCLDYLDTAIFGISQERMASSTRDVFVSLLRSLWEAHGCILEVGGSLSTLTVAVILPLNGNHKGKYVVCSCNVGDSLGYIYSKKHGVREFTQGSHDIMSMRDMRDALGALGPVDGNKPELSNLTFSMTMVDGGDIVFLTSDGISDNFDPVVGKFAEAWSSDLRQSRLAETQLAPKRQNKSSSAIYSRKENRPVDGQHVRTKQHSSGGSTSYAQHPVRPHRTKKTSTTTSGGVGGGESVVVGTGHVEKSASTSSANIQPSRPKYMRSHTVIEPRISVQKSPAIKIPRSAAGLPLVTGSQRHALTLLRLEDLLSYGINGTLRPCPSARHLCHLLVDFVKMITSARRKTLEQRELFYKLVTDSDGVKREVELTRVQHRATRKRIVDSSAFSSLPGKLDHASVVAFNVGCGLRPTEFKETNF